MRSLRLWALFFVLLGIDGVSKSLALAHVPSWSLLMQEYPYGGIGIFPSFLGVSCSLNCIGNSGAAWGIFSGYPGLLFTLRILIIICLVVYSFQEQAKRKVALCFILAGAIGNILDYLLYGYVVDFIHIMLGAYSFPIFNLADCYISLGAAYFVFLSLNERRSAVQTDSL